jgi:uncharacterized protein (DUF849 family)
VDNLVFLRNTAEKLLGSFIWSAAAAGKHPVPYRCRSHGNGRNVRVGLEDNLYIRPGVLATSNAEQVAGRSSDGRDPGQGNSNSC